jgi:hypothetical protein
MNKKIILSTVLVALSVTGCDYIHVAQPEVFDHGDEAFFDRPNLAQSSTAARTEQVRRDPFSIKFRKITDKRRPMSLAGSPAQDIIHEYDPDKLQGGARALFQNHLDEYFGVASRGAEELIAELDIRYLRTTIRTGNLLTSRYGRYEVGIEADVRIRDGLGTVYVMESYKITHQKGRYTHTGYQPTEQLDQARMHEAIGDAMRKLGDRIARDTRLAIRNARKPK